MILISFTHSFASWPSSVLSFRFRSGVLTINDICTSRATRGERGPHHSKPSFYANTQQACSPEGTYRKKRAVYALLYRRCSLPQGQRALRCLLGLVILLVLKPRNVGLWAVDYCEEAVLELLVLRGHLMPMLQHTPENQ